MTKLLTRAEIAALFDIPEDYLMDPHSTIIREYLAARAKFIAEELPKILRPWVEQIEAKLAEERKGKTNE